MENGDQLPAELIKNVHALSGGSGDRWLADLPRLRRDLESRWSIRVGMPFANGEYNYVAQAETSDGTPVVLKIAPPRGDDDFLSEIEYLSHRQGRGAVKLLRKDIDRQAILIERAIPGESLTSLFQDEKASAVAPAIDLLLTISQPAPDDLSFAISLDDWFDGLKRYKEKRFDAERAERAIGFYDMLSGQTEQIGYLHGDFHPDNIVSSERSPFLAIDPKGIIGHIGYDAAVFLNNFHWWQENELGVKERLARAVEQFSTSLSIPVIEIRRWAFAQMVLSAWWTFDEMPTLYYNEVEKADIWDV